MAHRSRLSLFLLTVIALSGSVRPGWAKFEQEQLAFESQLQQRIEAILSKTLPAERKRVLERAKVELRHAFGK